MCAPDILCVCVFMCVSSRYYNTNLYINEYIDVVTQNMHACHMA